MDKGENLSKKMQIGNSLAVQRLGLCTSTAVAPRQGTKIPQASQHGQQKKKKQM